NLDRCRITAPFAGRIDQVGVELGERIQVGQELLALLNPELIEVPIELPISVRHRVRSDAACRLSIDSSGEVVWSGRVQRISPSASEFTRTFKLYVEVDNRQQDERLVPGSFVRAEIDGPTLEDVLIIPRGVVQQGRVYVYRTGQAHPCPVQVVRHLQDRAVVTGLQPGDRVITSNLDALYDGAAVSLEGTARATPPSDGEALTAGTETR
ncbi:MAG: efflux RND transporter periplasmic adaptor subunit, partial [bacterium]|nr:efflux RND transporter periplasmic adaptor subunit [bacterium]